MSTGFLFRSVEQDKCGSDGLVVRHCCCFDGEKASATLDVQGKRRTSLFGCLTTVSAISYCIVWSVGGAVRRDCLFAVSWQLQSSSMTFLKTLTWLFPPSSSILSLSLSFHRLHFFFRCCTTTSSSHTRFTAAVVTGGGGGGIGDSIRTRRSLQ